MKPTPSQSNDLSEPAAAVATATIAASVPAMEPAAPASADNYGNHVFQERLYDLSRAILGAETLEAVREAAQAFARAELFCEHAHVFFDASESEEELIREAFLEPRVRLRNRLQSESVLVVPIVLPRERVACVVRLMDKIDWAAFDAGDVERVERLGLAIALRAENLKLEAQILRQRESSIRALASAIEAKDRYTAGHTRRVYDYADRIALEMPEVDAVEREAIRLAGLLHDVGKIGVPDEVLLKPAALTPDEWDIIRRHAQWGHDIVIQISGLEDVAEMLRLHHERWDGSGYPEGRSGTRIPLGARIIAVADAFDAMVTDRPYRNAMRPSEAIEILHGMAGTQFDPAVVEAFRRARLDLDFPDA